MGSFVTVGPSSGLKIPKPEPLDEPPPPPPPPPPVESTFSQTLASVDKSIIFPTNNSNLSYNGLNIAKPEPVDEPSPPPPPSLVESAFSQTLGSVDKSVVLPSNNSNLSYNVCISPDLPAPSFANEEEANAYAEYVRVSQMFRSSFVKRMQKYGDRDTSVVEGSVSECNVVSNVVVSNKKKYTQRSGELVRVTDVGPEDDSYFRGVMRRTRLTYNALRLLAISEDERGGREDVTYKRLRADLKASAMMRDGRLWLNRDKRIVGAIPGVAIGDVFFYRMEMCVIGLHGQPQAGIDYVPSNQSSNGEPIATSVIASGGYEDDEDGGDVVIYTGQGGQDKHGRQCMNQKLESGNLALDRSMYYGIEVRVIRGLKYEGTVTAKVFVYDGLYKIVESWLDTGRSGFGVYKFKLVRIPNQPEMGSAVLRFAENIRRDPLSVRPSGYVSFDISKKTEKIPVFFFNDVDKQWDPLYFDYIKTSVFPTYLYSGVGSGTGCDCLGECGDKCLCLMKNGGEFPYDRNGILLKGKPLIFECGPHCRCPPSCRNRVSQHGVKNRFEVFRSRETSWGVRSLDLIQAGDFICEFAGVSLTREQAQIFSMNGDNLVYPSRFSDKWRSWGDLSQIFSDYVQPSYPSIPPLDFAIYVSKMRNLACYMSHSSFPNAFVQFVLYDHNNVSFPHLMIFALENIPPLREIRIDYGIPDERRGKLAICN